MVSTRLTPAKVAKMVCFSNPGKELSGRVLVSVNRFRKTPTTKIIMKNWW